MCRLVTLVVAASAAFFAKADFDECQFDTNEYTNELCSDGIDNDCNGFSDCEDFDCLYEPQVTVCNYLLGEELKPIPQDIPLQLVLVGTEQYRIEHADRKILDVHTVDRGDDTTATRLKLRCVQSLIRLKYLLRSQLERIMVAYSEGNVPSSANYENFWAYEWISHGACFEISRIYTINETSGSEYVATMRFHIFNQLCERTKMLFLTSWR